ncbi:MAG: CCA tRNA nucleotidyltransferase [Rhodobacteraceae bacterium]|nr:CCA tRNA nucleotidyltransferase [Paracoccaceae bacterium]
MAQLLNRSGYRAFCVGGAVRDAWLGGDIRDIDIATDARPPEIIAIAGSAGIRSIRTGEIYGNVRYILNDRRIDVTSLRRDIRSDGRYPEIEFTDDLAEDAGRRDFTINALYSDPQGGLHDPLGILGDLRRGRVRFIGRAATRIREDYLRIVRFFRFHAQFAPPGSEPDAEAMHAVEQNLDGLRQVSRERIGREMLRLLAVGRPEGALSAMMRTGALRRCVGAADLSGIRQMERYEIMCGLPVDAGRRLALLGIDDPKATLRISRAAARRVARLRALAAADTTLPELAYRVGARDAVDAVLLRAVARGMAPDRDIIARAEQAAAQQCPVSAVDLMPAFSGRLLGDRLRKIENRWIRSEFRLSKGELLTANAAAALPVACR